MTLLPDGGAALPVSVTTTRKVQGGAAIPVYGYMTAPTDGRPALGGPAVPVRVLTAADLKQNGGQWTLEGRPYAMPVYTAPASTMVQGGPALAVYPVNAWPTVPVVSAFVPTDIAGLALWLKADAGLFKDAAKTQPCTSDGDAVYVWADQSGNGNDAVQATLAARPTRQTVSGKGTVVRFDGTDDFLQSSLAHLDPAVFFIVFKTGGVVNESAILSHFRAGLGYFFGWGLVAANGYGYRITPALADATFYSVYGIADSTNSGYPPPAPHSIYVNGVLNDATLINDYNWNMVNDAPATFIGGKGYSGAVTSGDVCEVLIYNSALSDANRALVETYLNTKWVVY